MPVTAEGRTGSGAVCGKSNFCAVQAVLSRNTCSPVYAHDTRVTFFSGRLFFLTPLSSNHSLSFSLVFSRFLPFPPSPRSPAAVTRFLSVPLTRYPSLCPLFDDHRPRCTVRNRVMPPIEDRRPVHATRKQDNPAGRRKRARCWPRGAKQGRG